MTKEKNDFIDTPVSVYSSETGTNFRPEKGLIFEDPELLVDFRSHWSAYYDLISPQASPGTRVFIILEKGPESIESISEGLVFEPIVRRSSKLKVSFKNVGKIVPTVEQIELNED